MTKTIPAHFIGQDVTAYALLAFMSEPGRRKIGALLADLNRELPGVLWPMPLEALHITLCEIIQIKPYGHNKEDLYALHKLDYEDGSAEILAATKPVRIRFGSVTATPQAIIVTGQDGGTFNALRDRLIQRFPLPAETGPPPNIVHCSIARYAQAVDLAEVQAVVRRHDVGFEEEVTEFKLVKHLVAPLLKYDTLRTYPLS